MQTTYYKSGRGKTKYFVLLQKEGLKCLEHVNLYQGKTRGLQGWCMTNVSAISYYEKNIPTLFPSLGSPLRLGGRCGSGWNFLQS